MVLFFEKNHSPALLSFGGNCALSSSKLILSTIIQYSILKNLWQRYTFILIFARKSKKKVIDEGFFLPHPSSAARIFSKITPVPSLPLKRGSTSPPAPSPHERAPTGKPDVLYSQTSFNCVDFRLRSAEHSSELDALLSLARKFAPAGLLVVFDAIES